MASKPQRSSPDAPLWRFLEQNGSYHDGRFSDYVNPPGASSKRGRVPRAARAYLAELGDVDLATAAAWKSGSEPIPDDLIEFLAEHFGVAVVYLMGWENAPRSAIPEGLRQGIAEHVANRFAHHAPGECESLVKWIEWRLGAELDLEGDSSDIPRLQRLRAALLEFLTEPLEAEVS